MLNTRQFPLSPSAQQVHKWAGQKPSPFLGTQGGKGRAGRCSGHWHTHSGHQCHPCSWSGKALKAQAGRRCPGSVCLLTVGEIVTSWPQPSSQLAAVAARVGVGGLEVALEGTCLTGSWPRGVPCPGWLQPQHGEGQGSGWARTSLLPPGAADPGTQCRVRWPEATQLCLHPLCPALARMA